jgi:diacylglycerol kinase (ATP)
METPATEERAPDIGLARIPKAFGYAVQGLAGAWRTEAAFRQEAIAAMLLVPLALLLPLPILQRLALVASVLAVMVVELINSSIESAIDRISLERHPLSKRAKDSASAAVLMAVAMAAMTWIALVGAWLFAPL